MRITLIILQNQKYFWSSWYPSLDWWD